MFLRALSALAVLAVLLPAPGYCLGEAKPWFGGVYAGVYGFSEACGMPAAEYLAAGLFAEPLGMRFLNPALFAGVLFPSAPRRSGAVRLQLSAELTLVDLPAPWLQRRFYFSTRFSPAVGVEALLSPESPGASPSSLGVLLAPLRIRAGDAVFTIAAVQLFWAAGGRRAGWGVVLFKSSLFLF